MRDVQPGRIANDGRQFMPAGERLLGDATADGSRCTEYGDLRVVASSLCR
jgi:hypothetical protein